MLCRLASRKNSITFRVECDTTTKVVENDGRLLVQHAATQLADQAQQPGDETAGGGWLSSFFGIGVSPATAKSGSRINLKETFEMNRILVRLALMLAVAIWLPTTATSQVSLVDGDWFINSGSTVKLPVLGPNTFCTPPGVGGCVNLKTVLSGHSTTPNGKGVNTGPGVAVAPAGGGVPGADTNVAAYMVPGGSVRLDPNVFNIGNTRRFTPVPNGFAVRQLDTEIAYKGPATDHNVGLPSKFQVPVPASTRLLNANNWLRPGNGMQARVAATSTPAFVGQTYTTIGAGFGFPTTGTFATTTLPITIRYTNGNNGNAFGGTMMLLLNGNGTLWLNGALFGNAASGGAEVPLRPTDTTRSRPRAFGNGWGLQWSGGQPAGHIRAGMGFNPPCTAAVPPAPAGCDLVTNIGVVVATSALAPAESSANGFAWTTGTVIGRETGTQGGAPATETLSGRGNDTTSITTGGGVRRNLSLVAAGYTRRVAPPSPLNTGISFGSVSMSFVPEPGASFALLGGITLLGVLTRRARR